MFQLLNSYSVMHHQLPPLNNFLLDYSEVLREFWVTICNCCSELKQKSKSLHRYHVNELVMTLTFQNLIY